MTSHVHYLPPRPLGGISGRLPLEYALMPRAAELAAEVKRAPDDLFTATELARVFDCDDELLRKLVKVGRRGPEPSGRKKLTSSGNYARTFTCRAIVAWLQFLDREYKRRLARQAKVEALRNEIAALTG